MSARARRFVHVFATFSAGGPQIRAAQLLQHLGPGHEHVIVAMDGRTEAAAQVPAGVAVEIVPPGARRGFAATVLEQRRRLGGLRPDLVLTYNWGAIETVAAARSLRLPLVHHEDGFLPEEAQRRLRRRSWLRRLLLRGVPVVVPSLVLQRIATTEWGLAAAHVHHLPNGVDLGRFRPRAPIDAPVVGTVGGLRAEKDHGNLLRALALLPDDVRCCIVGGGPLAESLRGEADALRVGARVELAGPVSDTAPWYARFQVFVLPSRTEQMPIAMLEAMACGLPVVATDVGDVRAILPPEGAPFVVPAGDGPALAQALHTLLGDRGLRERLGAANRRVVEQRYEARECLARFARVYDAACRPASR
jgi:glycosyltransferase involved in cell wall biosynthesis